MVPVPDAVNMFSALSHVPRGAVALQPSGNVPTGLATDFASRQAQQQTLTQQHRHVSDPTGRDFNIRYFYRPRLPQAANQEVNPLLKTVKPVSEPKQEVAAPSTRTVSIQTDYRENDTQTDPWTPDYIVRPGSAPEVLSLATLSYGHGLPAGLAEVEMIERARAKRAWEATLPPIDDLEQLDRRAKMMEEREMEEWRLREQEIERLQQQRLAIVQQQLQQRSAEQSAVTKERLDALWQTRQTQRRSAMQRAQRDTLTHMRRIARERQAVEPSVPRRDIIKAYADPASAVFAPVDREGGFSTDYVETDNKVKSKYLSTYKGLLELEASLPESLTQPRIAPPPRPSQVKLVGTAARATVRLQDTLKSAHTVIAAKPETPLPPAPLRFLEIIVPPPQRPPTPSVEIPSIEDEEKDLAIVLLQQLIRGRAAQNEMFVGKEQRKELIAELRSTHALQDAAVAAKKLEQEQAAAAQKAQAQAEHAARVKESVVLDVQAEHVGDTLDFLSKELVRLQEQRRIHAFALLAERTRRMREAEESGKRQVEEEHRRQHDEIFRQMVGVHMESVDTYLEDVIVGAGQAVADQLARQEVRQQAAIIAEVSEAVHAGGLDTSPEGATAIAAELVGLVLLPEVQRQLARDSVARHQRRFLAAAHQEIYSACAEVDATVSDVPRPRRSSSRPVTGTSRPGSSVARPGSSAAGRAASAKVDAPLVPLGE